MNSDFRPIPGYPGYVVSNNGCIYGPRQKMLNQHIDKDGYLITNCFIDKKIKKILMHRAVALAWIPNPEQHPTVDHINRNKQDNRVENLRWATHRLQSLNRYHKPNILNEKYIYKNKKYFDIRIQINRKKYCCGSFRSLTEAIEERDQILIALEESI